MREMTSKEPHEYDGKQYVVGDSVMVHREHVELLRSLGRAEITEKKRDLSAADPAQYETRDMAAAPPASYKTRDVLSLPRNKRRTMTLKAA